ncbi:MAG: T9SS type A sorting domain-containing protein [Bacteroidetes bacterium]|nr:MAG: T9SS type A sorting domain-containing protein [Bacteroidota bacterium]
MKTLIVRQIALVFVTTIALFAAPPDWNVNPSEYLFNSTITAVLEVNDTLAREGNIVGAFVGNEVRGVASPIQVGDTWMYFMTVYSNATDGETVTFKTYLSSADMVSDIEESVPFVANAINGDPATPFRWHTYVSYDRAPVLEGVPDQTVEQGMSFAVFDLNTYLTEFDGNQLILNVRGNTRLTVSINASRLVTVTAPSNFTGSETIVFKATDFTTNHYYDTDTAVFTVLPTDIPPTVGDIPDQTIGINGRFPELQLDNFLSLQDSGGVSWSLEGAAAVVGMPVPSWSVNPSLYQFSMNVTAKVYSRHKQITSGGHLLAAFSGNELRGVTQGTQVGDAYLFFLTVYSNTPGEQLYFRVYDAASEEILPVYERQPFSPNGVVGTPEIPTDIHAGYVIFLITNGNQLQARVVDTAWTGSERVLFIATDEGTLHSYSDSDDVAFSVLPDHTPIVSGLEEQTIQQGESFTAFDLDNYLDEDDGNTVTWSYNGNLNLIVSINGDNEVTIMPTNPTWIGSETIVFTVTDNTANALFSSDTITYTIEQPDHAPALANIPNQTVGLNGLFQGYDLDFYLHETDGDSIEWLVEYQTFPRGNPAPAWNVTPSLYQFSMNVTAEVRARNTDVSNGDYLLAAFAGNELRGVSQAVQAGSTWLFFITIYSNTQDEQLHFKLYDALLQDVLPVKEKFSFEANGIYGTPGEPYRLTSGNILVNRSPDNRITFDIVDTAWSGSETILFTARDAHRSRHYSATDYAIYTVISDHSPVVSGIPDQTVEQETSFAMFDLDNFLREVDGQEIIWGASYNQNYVISINANHETIITPRDPNWIGSDNVIFQARDVSTFGLFDVDTATFTIISVNHRPEIANTLSQEIPPSGSFTSFDLDSYLTEQDGDSVVWSYAFLPPQRPDAQPSWSVNPSGYQYSMTFTAQVTSLSNIPVSSNNRLAAFAGNELRGVTAPVQVGGTTLYFLTVYANGDGEQLRFQFYDGTAQRLLPVKETVLFVANSVVGGPLNPFSFNAGNLLVTMAGGNVVGIERTLSSWLGTETLMFIAKEINTRNNYADTSYAQFSVVQDAFGSSQTSVLFGDIPVHTTEIETVTIANRGTGSLEISSVTVDNPDYSVSPANANVLEGYSQEFIVRFSPSSSGNKNAQLMFIHNAYSSPRVIALEGSGQYLVITATANGNGTITPTGASNIGYGANRAYEIIPDHGYRMDSVVVDSNNMGALTEFEFSGVTAHHVIDAYFSIIPAYGVQYRTATMEDWATAVDQRGLRRQINRKYDKIFFEFDLTADQSRLLELSFNMNTSGVITKGTTALDTIAVFSGKSFIGDLSSSLLRGQVLHINGVGSAGRYITTRYKWGTTAFKPLLKKEYKRIQLGIPLPNLHNVGKEMFGVGQRGAFPSGLRIGVSQGVRGGGSVIHFKYKDVQKSLAQETPGGFALHTQGPRCFDSLGDGTQMTYRERSLPVDKQNNKLFSEALTLRLNITASVLGKFPAGLGELTYRNQAQPDNPFNGMMVREISGKADTMLSCQPLAGNTPATLDDLYETIRAINGSFRTDGRLDTISFYRRTRLTGTKRLVDVPYLSATPGVVAQTVSIEEDVTDETADVPEQVALYQNYPNPFNPSTVIRYQLSVHSVVTLKVYNMLGQEVTTLVDGMQDAGFKTVEWDASNLPSGVYSYRLNVESRDGMLTYTDVKRMLLIK